MRVTKFMSTDFQSDGGQVVLGLDHLQGAFCLLGLGCGLALLLLLVEILVHRYAKRP